jgi:hypothetical protein
MRKSRASSCLFAAVERKFYIIIVHEYKNVVHWHFAFDCVWKVQLFHPHTPSQLLLAVCWKTFRFKLAND